MNINLAVSIVWHLCTCKCQKWNATAYYLKPGKNFMHTRNCENSKLVTSQN